MTTVEAITARHLRAFLLHLGEGHSPGGVRVVYRAVKAFLRWRELVRRRAFGLQSPRHGVDVYALRRAHARSGPVDHAL